MKTSIENFDNCEYSSSHGRYGGQAGAKTELFLRERIGLLNIPRVQLR